MTCQCGATGHTYNVQCVACCARLVEATRPSKKHAEGMLKFIGRMPGTPKRVHILEATKGMMK